MPYGHEISTRRREEKPVYTPAGKGYVLCQLASGEEFVVRSEGQDSSWTEKSLSESLLEAACERWVRIKCFGNKEDYVWPARVTLYESASWVLSKVKDPSGKNCLSKSDIKYLAEGIAKGRPFPEQTLPYWVFLSIAYHLRFWTERDYFSGGQKFSIENTRFVPSQPTFIELRPSEEELEKAGINKEKFASLLTETPPIMISKAVPFFGLVDEEYTYSFIPQLTLLRKGSGLSNGKLVFPGGHAACPLDLTAWRELHEEVVYGEGIQEHGVEEVRFIALIDEAFLSSSNELKHFLVSVFSFAIGCGCPAEDYLFRQLELRTGDGMNVWVPFDLEPSGRFKLVSQEVRQGLGNIERLAVEFTENLQPSFVCPNYPITTYQEGRKIWR